MKGYAKVFGVNFFRNIYS